MSEPNQILTQEEIDNLVTKNIVKKAPQHATVSSGNLVSKTSLPDIPALQETPIVKVPPPVNKTIKTATSPVNSPSLNKHEECIAAGEIRNMGQQIFELSSRLSKLEAMVAKFDGKGPSSNDVAHIKTAIQQMKNVSSQVEVITEGLRGTAGYNLNKNFKCGSCGTMGVVAIKVRCNQCGQENWWGWWPKKK